MDISKDQNPVFHGPCKDDAIARAKTINGIVYFARGPDQDNGQESDLFGYWSDDAGATLLSWELLVWKDGIETSFEPFKGKIIDYSSNGLKEFVPVHWCIACNDAKVADAGSLCGQCKVDKERGYRVRSLAGRCSNGFESDHGHLFHAVRFDNWKSLCGAKPGCRSVGWSDWGKDKPVTCPRCLKKLSKGEQP